jgi:hypothetical protein
LRADAVPVGTEVGGAHHFGVCAGQVASFEIKLLGFDQGERSSTTSKGLEIDLGFEHISAWRPI